MTKPSCLENVKPRTPGDEVSHMETVYMSLKHLGSLFSPLLQLNVSAVNCCKRIHHRDKRQADKTSSKHTAYAGNISPAA